MPRTPSDNPFENWDDGAAPESSEPGPEPNLFDFDPPTAAEAGPPPEWLTAAVLTHSGKELSPEVYRFFADPPPEIGALRTAYSTCKLRGSIIRRRDTSDWHAGDADECSFVGSKGVARFRQPKAGGKRARKVLLFADAVRLYAEVTQTTVSPTGVFQFTQECPEQVVIDGQRAAYGYTECHYAWQGKGGETLFDCSGRSHDPAYCTKDFNRLKVPPDAYEPRLMFMRSAEAAWTGWLLPHALKAVRTGKGVLFRVKDSDQSIRLLAAGVVYQPESGEPVEIPYSDAEFASAGSAVTLRRKNARHGARGLLRGRDATYAWEAHTIGNVMLLVEVLRELEQMRDSARAVEMFRSMPRP